MKNKLIFEFSKNKTDGDSSLNNLLGGKGANLAEMSNMEIPVPPGFTITTEVCNYFTENKNLPNSLDNEIRQSVSKLENLSDKSFGGVGTPLLLSVRSGGRVSMPGMMDSILNIGLNDSNVSQLAEAFNDERFALDSYRRLIQMYSNVVLGVEHERFEAVLENKKRMDNVVSDADFNVDQLNWIINAYKNTVERFTDSLFPQEPYEQLTGAIEAVFNSWQNKRAATYRKINNIPDSWGTGATIQTMVFGNLNDKSGTGVAFTRNPSNGDKELYGEYLINAQGEEEASKGRDVILVRDETSPEDIHGMHSSVGILTTKGGMTSHAAVVARGMGKPCVVGAESLIIDNSLKTISNGTKTLNEGDIISIDGGLGEVYIGELQSEPPKPSLEFNTLMDWCDEFKSLKIRANAETITDTKKSLDFGAEGIGLCRTEHMFFEGDRIIPMREMIMSDTKQGRERALRKLITYQISDFEALFLLLKDKPITVRLLDPPMHEFLPKSEIEMTELGNAIGVSPAHIREILVKLSESNPMLGHRGVRLGLSYPEIYEMQVEAILRAAYNLNKKEKISVSPEIMIPLVMNAEELSQMKGYLIEKISKLEEELSFTFDFTIGTMIELPSAALNSSSIAEHADFFSFGTNDLTQTTLGLSRDDASKFLNTYVENDIFSEDPFVSIDKGSVGRVVEMSVSEGKSFNKDLKVGVCGEHAGEANSIKFFNTLQIDYISCSPFRIPTAKLAAAQAEIIKTNQ